MRKSISSLVTDLQKENERLLFLKKLFNQACKTEFGLDIKAIHEAIQIKELHDSWMVEKQGQQAAMPLADRGQAPIQTTALPTAEQGEEW